MRGVSHLFATKGVWNYLFANCKLCILPIKVSNIQPQLERLIAKNYFLNVSAKLAYKAYVRAYESHSLKQVSNSMLRHC